MIYDCFCFFNELDLLDIRLHVHNDLVDKFVICESNYTHQGDRKPLFYQDNKSKFKEFEDKIIHLICDEGMTAKPNCNSQANMKIQRNYCINGCNNAEDNDLIMISDADEILDPNTFEQVRNVESVAKVIQNLYYYYFNWQLPGIWQYFKICRKKDLKTDLHTLRWHVFTETDTNICGGWHWSYMGGAEMVRTKLLSFDHHEYSADEYTDINYINECLRKQTDVLKQPTAALTKVPLNAPDYVMDNLDRFKHFISE